MRYLRKEHSLSQEDIANRLGYKSYTTIQKWESDVTTPDVKTVNKLAEMFGVSMEDLANKDLTRSNYDVTGFTLTSDEVRLIEAYRLLNPIIQRYAFNSITNESTLTTVNDEIEEIIREYQASSAHSRPGKITNVTYGVRIIKMFFRSPDPLNFTSHPSERTRWYIGASEKKSALNRRFLA